MQGETRVSQGRRRARARGRGELGSLEPPYSPRRSYERGMVDGIVVGLAVGLAVLAVVMWLWAVPTVDGALAAAAEALGAAS